MRVGMCTKWIDEAYTGVGRYTIKVLEHMMDLEGGPEFHLIHRQQGGDPLYGRAAEEHIYKSRIESLWWHYQDRFCKALSSQLDVIHEPFVGFRTRMDCPQVLTFHDAVPLMHPEFAPRTFSVYFKRMMPKVVSRADAIICNSEKTREDLLQHYSADPGKTFVTYLGVDPPDVVGESTFTGKEPYMLALSNTQMKNIGFTVGEFISYKDTHEGDLRLIVVGSDYSGLSQGRTDVEVMDYLPRDDFVRLMAGAEALLFPSHYEGFGFPPLEAMSMGVPTVVSDRGSLPEVVGDASMVVDIDRKGSLVEAIHRLRTDEGLAAELRAKGNERYKGFTWDNCAKGTLAVYEGLLG